MTGGGPFPMTTMDLPSSFNHRRPLFAKGRGDRKFALTAAHMRERDQVVGAENHISPMAIFSRSAT